MTKMFTMKRVKLFLLQAAAFLVFAGCESLDEVPPATLSPTNFYANKVQVRSAYTASMEALYPRWGGYSYPGLNFFIYDDQFGGYGTENGADLNIPSNMGAELWTRHYTALLNINSALKSIKEGNVEGVTQSELEELEGWGRFLRGFNYFMLVRMFGGVPLYLEDDDPALNPEARASVEEVYAAITSDLEYAASKLQSVYPDAGVPNRGAANGLLAKAYLTMATAPLNKTEYYQKAADAAKAVIEDGSYSLIPEINMVFDLSNKYASEKLWSFNATTDDPSTEAQIFAPTVAPYNGWMNEGIQPEFSDDFKPLTRKDAYILTEVVTEEGTVPYTEWGPGRPAIKKYLYMPLAEYNGYINNSNQPIIRYADVLLIFAEAENMATGGPTQAAVDAANQVIDRANNHVVNPDYPLLTTAMSKEDFDKAIIQERSFELCFEIGDRWFDICRKRLLLEVTNFPQNFSEDDYLYPIPEPDLRLNPLLTQNPGYPVPGGG